ncbi:MAG TPA: PD-(D/E)XK nuclease family protein [Actinomycetales bacterium]|nr:PD-(D/E)XK nuclease family protein [Actinomycetales bacterium]
MTTGSYARALSLSPSRARDFQQCPLLYRFRVIDELPEPPSAAALRGTLVHSVLEDIFDLPAAARTIESAQKLVGPAWDELLKKDPEAAGLFATPQALEEWLKSAEALVANWFELEDPQRLEPHERETFVQATVGEKLRLRGIVDRLDVAPSGAVRVVDYKTGRSPAPRFEAETLFQMRFYALVIWRTRGVVPALLQLVFLGDGKILRLEPTEQQLIATERKILALWEAIERAARTGDWRPTPSRLCDWCHHKPICPAFDGQAPQMPTDALQKVLGPDAS